jgi:hypothetical protein
MQEFKCFVGFATYAVDVFCPAEVWLDTLKWKTLQCRRKEARLNMLYKIQNKEVAISTENKLIPPS